jgi:YHS domain-containing protein
MTVPRRGGLLLGASLLVWAGCGEPDDARPGLSEYNLDDGGLALHGYSPVSYLEDGAARIGKPDFVLTHRGVTYRFASSAERDLFRADPDRYEPEYGGWCAYGASVGIRWDVDPENFEIYGDRVFLFSRNDEADARELWDREDRRALIARADRYWESALTD